MMSKDFFKKLNFNFNNIPLSQNTFLFTLDNPSINILTNKSVSQFNLPPGFCINPTLIDSASIVSVGLRYIITKNNLNLFRLSMNDRTKNTSTSAYNCLK